VLAAESERYLGRGLFDELRFSDSRKMFRIALEFGSVACVIKAMKTRLLLILLLLSLALTPRLCRGWSGPGHMVVAAEAYRELPWGVKRKARALLKSHPEYAKWEAAYRKGPTDVDFSLYVFMRASTWPDEIRRKGDAAEAHPHWHYIDYPLKAPNFEFEAGPAPNDDVLYGIAESEKTLSDKGNEAAERAIALSWMIHLIGDLHQPLHCCSLVNETYPQGDKGGNDFYVAPATKGIKLHSFWDGLLGTRVHPPTQLKEASRIAKEHKRRSLAELAEKSPEAWSLEGRSLAVEKAYLRGKLKGSSRVEGAPTLPEGYTKTAKLVAEGQAALAGYRLADELKAYLK
jgi:hypothetical protein